LGERGAIGFTDEHIVRAAPYPVSRIVDTVGAGDAFAAGLLSILGEYAPAEADLFHKALHTANAMGALATQYRGDWEGLPKRDELDRILSGGRDITR
jgi:2-dehydro-3-deoxygluconokinase